MKARRRLSDGKMSRDAVDAGTADAVAFGTIAAGLKPQAAGRVNLKFALRRPHSLSPASQTVGFDVTVK